MKQSIQLLSLLLFLPFFADAQYNEPHSATYHKGTGKYYFTNNTGSNVMYRVGESGTQQFHRVNSGALFPKAILCIGDSLYVLDNDKIKIYPVYGGSTGDNPVVTHTNGSMSTSVQYMTHDNRGNIYIASFFDQKIFKYNIASGNFSNFADTNKNLNGIVYDHINDRLIVNTRGNGGQLFAVNMSDSTFSHITTTSHNNLEGMTIDPCGRIYVAAGVNPGYVFRYDNGMSMHDTLVSNANDPLGIYYNAYTDFLTVCENISGGGDVDWYSQESITTRANILLSDTTICNLDTIMVSADTANAASITWSSNMSANIGSPNDTITSFYPQNGPGTYTLRVDAPSNTGCPDGEDSIQIIVQALPDANVGNGYMNLCKGDSLPLVGYGQNGLITWSDIGTGGQFSPIDNNLSIYFPPQGHIGSITIAQLINDARCGSDADSFTISIGDSTNVNLLSGDTTLCESDTLNIHGTGTNQAAFQWDLYDGGFITDTMNENSKFVAGSGGSFRMTLTAISGNACPDVLSDTLTVTADALPSVADAGEDQFLCNNPNTIMNATIPTSGNGVWRLISGGGILTDTANANSALVSAPVGINSFEWEVSNGQCPSSVDTVVIEGLNKPNAKFGFAVNGADVQLNDSTTNNPNAWKWDFDDGDSSDIQNPMHTYTASGEYMVCLTAWNATNCMDSICQQINIVIINSIPDNNLNVSIWPNPAENLLNVQIESAQTQYRLLNMLGQELQNNKLNAGINQINTSEMPSGLYLIELLDTQSGAILVHKVQIK